MPLSPLHIAGIIGLALTGFYIFRAANSQKDEFKRDPKAAVAAGEYSWCRLYGLSGPLAPWGSLQRCAACASRHRRASTPRVVPVATTRACVGACVDAGVATIDCGNGKYLLAGGWWGLARHINYLGDWLLSLAMCLPTGFATPVTYFYPIYFAVLLAHRERRDDHKCAAKYGKHWEEYTRRVPYRIVPGVY